MSGDRVRAGPDLALARAEFWRRRDEGECRGDDQNGEDAECDDSHTR